jgi:putative ABC transport system permease protein
MFFLTYLGRELRRRMRQAVVIALGLAVGVGLVVTVIAASAGVKKAQADVLSSLYGVGTDVTVTGKAPTPSTPGSGPPKGGTSVQVGPGGAQICHNGKCQNAAGQTIDNLGSAAYGPINYSSVADVAKLHDVTAAAGGLSLTDNQITIPKDFGQAGSSFPQPNSFTVDGVDLAHLSLGPLTSGTIKSGRSLKSSDGNADVAVVDSNYATSHNLKTGGTITIDKTKFTVVGVVTQPQSGSPPDVYIPLPRAQAMGTAGGTSLKNKVNTIYVTAASASDISTVQKEIEKLLPGTTVTTASSLANEVTGSVSNAAKLANDLGKWLSILVLIAAFAVASLLTLAAVGRRVPEFGTLKAIGWRGRRIVGQVMGESVAVGVIGAALGVGLAFAGAAIIDGIAPKLYATLAVPTGQHVQSAGPGGAASLNPTANHTVGVPMSAVITPGAIALAVVLAIAGGLIAGTFASWRIGRLRPVQALSRVA